MLNECDAISDLYRLSKFVQNTAAKHVGTVGLLDHESVGNITLAAGLLQRDKTAMMFLPKGFNDARRFPGCVKVPAPPQRPYMFPSTTVPTVLDRVDVLVCIHTEVALPGALALVHSALALMGHVLRDASVLRGILNEIRPGEASARRGLVVALGLLGESVPFDIGVSDPNDPLDIEAYILASTLVDAVHGLEAATLAYASASNPLAWDVADAALARLEAGDVIGVVG
jgi:hypothetical protein